MDYNTSTVKKGENKMTVGDFMKWVFDNNVSMDSDIYITSHNYKNSWSVSEKSLEDDCLFIDLLLDNMEDGFYDN